MEPTAKVPTRRESGRAAAKNKKKTSARRNRVKILIFMDIKKRLSALKPTPSVVEPYEGLVEAFLGDSPSPTRAAMAALPPTIVDDEENTDAAPKCCIIQ